MTLAKSGWLLTGLAALVAYLLTPAIGPSMGDLTRSSFPDALLALATLAQIAIAWWVLLVVALASVRPSSRLMRIITPAVVRQALFVGAVGALAVSPSYAAESVPGSTHSVAGLQLPDRPAGSVSRTEPAPALSTASGSPAAPTSITVKAGDSLWGIAARSLPSNASVTQIAAETHRWHEANRAVIGADPDVLFPGQQLTSPLGKDLS